MVQEINELIAKIQEEGVKVAEDRTRSIVEQAKQRAQTIIAEAQKRSGAMLAQAKDEVAKLQKSGRVSLEQTARDLLLALREEINAMLERLVLEQVREVFTPEELSKLIAALVKESSKGEGEIVVSLKKDDLEKLERGFLGRLRAEAKKGITLRPSGEISGGFTISYDSGKSHYDFTDKAIAERLSMQLKPNLAELLKKTASNS